MRSIEVDEAIKNLKDDCRGTELNTIVCYKTDIKTALVYIEELEKKLECIKNITPSGYINGKYLEEIAKRYINKNKIKDIIDTYYPDVAIVKLNGLLEEEE